jgi:hypothetical protein
MSIAKYDKRKAKALNYKWREVSNVCRMIKFQTLIMGGKLSKMGKIATFIKADESLSKREVNAGLLNYNDNSYVAYYSFFSTNRILTYSAKTRKWSRGANYDTFVNDLNSCISKKYKITKLNLAK